MNDVNDSTDVVAFEQKAAPLDQAAERAQQLLVEIEDPLGYLYNQAEQRGDAEAQNAVMAAWESSRHLASLIPAFAAALRSGGAAVQTLRVQRDEIAEEYGTLIQALSRFDVDDARLAGFAQVIEEEVMEYVSDHYLDEALDAVTMSMHEDFHIFLMTGFQTSHVAIGELVDTLRGEGHPLTAEQHALIQQLLDSFQPGGAQ